MRILFFSDVYFPRVNGVSTSIQTFAREFSHKGVEVVLVAPEYPTPYEDRFEIIRIPSRYLPLDPEDRFLKSGCIQALTPQLKARDFDLLHIHTPFVAHYSGLKMAQRLGIPVVESYHTFFEEYLYNYLPLIPKRTLKLIARRFSASQCNSVDGLIVPSRPMLEVLRGYGVENRAEIIPTGIELDEFKQGDGQAFRQRHGIAADRPVLIHVGRVAHEKNIGFLIQMLDQLRQQLPEVLLVIAGEGPARDALQRQVNSARLHHHVQFVGYLRRDGELQDCYAAGDAFVFASRTETQGLVLLEAMALGVPVVSTAVMGTKDVLVDGRGCLVAEEDIHDFSTKTLRLLTDAELRREQAEAARVYAREWTAPVLAERMLGFYRQIIE